MNTSLFLAQLFGVYMVVMGLALLLNQKFYKKAIDEYLNSPAMIMIGGMIALILGLTAVTFHNVWSGGFAVVVTVIAWLVLIKGLFKTLLPFVAKNWASRMTSSGFMTLWGVIVLVVGLYLAYMGYFA